MLRQRLLSLGIHQNDLDDLPEHSFLSRYAGLLRAVTIQYLGTNPGDTARYFRNTYSSQIASALGRDNETLDEFLQTQAQPNAPGTSYEAVALADILGCNLRVTFRSTQGTTTQENTSNLHNSDLVNAPTIHLYYTSNSNSAHWHIDPNFSSTDGGGGHNQNCLYNAFLQAAMRIIRPAPQSAAKSQPNVAPVVQTTPAATMAAPSPTTPSHQPAPAKAQSAVKQIDQSDDIAHIYTDQVKQTFARLDSEGVDRESKARQKLQLLNTQSLIDACQKTLQVVGRDTYLKNRLEKYAVRERHLNRGYFKNIVTTRNYSKDQETILREELIHSLTKEAWRNQASYDVIMSLPNSPVVSQNTSTLFNQTQSPVVPPGSNSSSPPQLKT